MGKMRFAPIARDSGDLPETRPIERLNGRGPRSPFASGAASNLAKVHSAQSTAVRTRNRLLVRSRQRSRIAQSQIERLVTRNNRLQQELIQLMHREAQARRLAYHDALTGLPNRTLLEDRFSQAISVAQRHSKMLAMLLIDLDGFKSVNDMLGHATGDKLLCAIAGRLLLSIRGADTACRHGGDEFAIMLPEVENSAMAAAVARKIRAHLSEPHFFDDHEIRITASVGIALYPVDGKNYDQLMRCADGEMYRAKATSCGAYILALSRPHESSRAVSLVA